MTGVCSCARRSVATFSNGDASRLDPSAPYCIRSKYDISKTSVYGQWYTSSVSGRLSSFSWVWTRCASISGAAQTQDRTEKPVIAVGYLFDRLISKYKSWSLPLQQLPYFFEPLPREKRVRSLRYV